MVLDFFGLVLLDDDKFDEDMTVLWILYQLEYIGLGVLIGLGLLIEDYIVFVVW